MGSHPAFVVERPDTWDLSNSVIDSRAGSMYY